MKKFMAILLTLAMLFTIAAPAYAAGVEDVSNAANEAISFFDKVYEKVHDLMHILAKAFSIKCPFCGKKFIVASPGKVDEALDKAKSGDTVDFKAGNYGVITLDTLDGVTLDAADGVIVEKIVTTSETVLKNVTITGFELETEIPEDKKSRDCGIKIDPTATIENLVIEDTTFTGPSTYKNCEGINGNNTSATITVKNCTFDGVGYALYSTGSGGFAELVFDGCAFNDIYSWVVHAQYGFLGNSTITGCTFNECEDGIAKHGTFAEGKTFTITNNTVADNCKGHDGKDAKWFELKTASSVVSGNTYGGAEWVPGAAQGLKAA